MKSQPDAFCSDIYVKTNCTEVLDSELKRFEKLGRKSILIVGNVSDAYQPIEMKYRLTRKILSICLKHNYPLFIETKSPLILEDLDLFRELGKRELIGVGMTITSCDEAFTRLVEPRVPRKKYSDHTDSIEDMKILTLKTLSSEGIDTYLHITPYFPIITEKDLEKIVNDASKAKVTSIIMAPLELTRGIQKRLNAALQNTAYAYLISLYNSLYFEKGRRLGGRFTTSQEEHFRVEKKVAELCKKFNVKYWSFTNLQFNTYQIDQGIYKWGYPVLNSYYKLIQEKGRITLKDAVGLAKLFPVDNRYLSALKDYWRNGKLFEGIHGIKYLSQDEIMDDSKHDG